jgi:hypothetical protein
MQKLSSYRVVMGAPGDLLGRALRVLSWPLDVQAGEVRVVVRLVPCLVEPGRALSEVAIRLGEPLGAASRPRGDYFSGNRFDSVKFPR